MPLSGLHLRAATPAALAAIRSLVNEACGCPEVQGLAMRFEGARSELVERIVRDLAWCLVADYKGNTIGHISCWQGGSRGCGCWKRCWAIRRRMRGGSTCPADSGRPGPSSPETGSVTKDDWPARPEAAEFFEGP